MGHSENQGLVTPMKGAILAAVRVVDLTEDDCTVAEDLGAGLVESVSNDSTGIYTVQLAVPYPPVLCVCLPKLSNPDGTTDLRDATYQEDSYDADAGTFVIQISNDDDSGAPVLADPDTNAELHLWMVFGRYTTV